LSDGLPLLQPQRASEPWFIDAVKALEPEVAVIVAWGSLIPESLLAVPKQGWVNLHFSLLPAWRGAAPVQRALMAGERTTGVTVFRLVRELDAGPIFLQKSVAISSEENGGQLIDRLAQVGAMTMVNAMTEVEAGRRPQPQSDKGISQAPKLTVDELRIDWQNSAISIHNLVRAVAPTPGAWTVIADRRLKLLQTKVVSQPDLAPGQVLATKHDLVVGTGDGTLSLVEIKAEGKSAMSAADWARGARLGDVL